MLVRDSNNNIVDCARIGNLVPKSTAPLNINLINWKPDSAGVFAESNCQEAQDAGCAVAGPSPSVSAPPSPTPSAEPPEVIAIATDCGRTEANFIYIPTSLLKYEDINDNVFHTIRRSRVRAIESTTQFNQQQKTAWPARTNGVLVINANGTCYSIETGRTVSVTTTLPQGKSITDDTAIIDAIKNSQLKAAITAGFFSEYCNNGCTPSNGVQPQPELSLVKAEPANSTGKYGYDFINNNLTADTATKVTQAAASAAIGQIDIPFDITIKHKDVPNNDATGTTYRFKLNQNISDVGDSSKVLQETQAFGFLLPGDSITSTNSLDISFKKEGGQINIQPSATGTPPKIEEKSNIANADTATFRIFLRVRDWAYVLDKYIGNRTEQPISGETVPLECSLSGPQDVVFGTADKETVNLYIPLSSFFIGVKDDTIAVGDIRTKLDDFVKVKGRKLCINGKDAETNCETSYQNTSFLLRAINLGGVGGTFTSTITSTNFTPDSGVNQYYVGNVPDWWGEPQAMPNGSNFPFAKFRTQDLVVNLKVYKQNVSSPPKDGEILLAGEHVRVITFGNVNEGNSPDNEFTLKVVVPATRVEVD